MEEKTVIVWVHYFGDRSAGINPYTTKITLEKVDADLVNDPEWRKDVRIALQEAASVIYGDEMGPEIRFDDECPDCGRKDCDGHCMGPAEE